jgi:hypothetical protein
MPNRLQPDLEAVIPSAAVPDWNAPLGSSNNPHVFEKDNQIDWATFGAMHTNQDKEAWDSAEAFGHTKRYTETTNPYNKGAAGQDTKDTLGLDAAFRDSAVKEIEEWVVLASSQDAGFFAALAGVSVPDPATGTGAFKSFDPASLIGGPSKNNGGKEALEQLQGLIGEEFVYTNFMSTAIPNDKEFLSYSRPIRVLVRVPPGSKALYVSGNPKTLNENPYGVTKQNPISYFKDGEMEMVLPRKQTLRIVDVVKSLSPSNTYTIDVIVEVVDQPNV